MPHHQKPLRTEVPGQDTTAWLTKHALFGGLPTQELRHLKGAVSEEHYAKGTTIYTEVESPHALWVLKKGRVRLVRYSSSGRAFALSVLTTGGVFCIPSLMNHCPYPCRAIADTDSDLLRVPAARVHEILGRYPAFACEALRLVCQDCCRAHALCSASQERVEQRVLTLLVHLLDSFGPSIPLSRQQVAELAGVARETANRILLKLEETGAIRLAFKQLTVQDPARLHASLDHLPERS